MKKIRVHATSKSGRKQAKIMEVLFNLYVKEHEQEILATVFRVWKDRMLYATEPPKEWYGTGVAECVQGIDFDKSYGGTD